MASMLDIGVSTGAASGSALPSQNAIAGDLTLDADTLTQALTSNPSGVAAMLKSWSQSFSGTGRHRGSGRAARSIPASRAHNQQIPTSARIQAMQETLSAKQTALQAQFAALEATLSQNQSTASWLTSQISSLPTISSK